MSAQEKVLDLIFGRWRSQILYAGVKLGIFDALAPVPKRQRSPRMNWVSIPLSLIGS
jgi:hypothetical protein